MNETEFNQLKRIVDTLDSSRFCLQTGKSKRTYHRIKKSINYTEYQGSLIVRKSV